MTTHTNRCSVISHSVWIARFMKCGYAFGRWSMAGGCADDCTRESIPRSATCSRRQPAHVPFVSRQCIQRSKINLSIIPNAAAVAAAIIVFCICHRHIHFTAADLRLFSIMRDIEPAPIDVMLKSGKNHFNRMKLDSPCGCKSISC